MKAKRPKEKGQTSEWWPIGANTSPEIQKNIA
jgi:hypothetical protein